MTITYSNNPDKPNRADNPEKQEYKNSLSHMLKLEEEIAQAQHILTQTNNAATSVKSFLDHMEANKTKKNEQEGFWCSSPNYRGFTSTLDRYNDVRIELNQCLGTLKMATIEESKLTAERRQEEALDSSNKMRSFCLRIATTGGTIIIGILLLNLALYLKLDVPRILTPDIPSKMLVTPKMLQTEVLNLRRELGHLKAKLEASSVKPDTVSVAVTLDRPDKLKQSDVAPQ